MNSTPSIYQDVPMQSHSHKVFEPSPIIATPELIFKMSKKIAQLTKVIYFVNLRNDLHKGEMEALSNKFEHQIEQITLECKSNDIRYQSEISKLEASKKLVQEMYQNQILEMQKDFDQKRQDMDKKYSELQKSWENKWEHAIAEHQKEALSFTSKVDALKELLRNSQQEKSEIHSEITLQQKKYTVLESEFETARKTWAGEKYLLEKKIEASEFLHNERYSKAHQEHQKEIENVCEKHAMELFDLQVKIEKLHTLHDEKVKEISSKLEQASLKNETQLEKLKSMELEKKLAHKRELQREEELLKMLQVSKTEQDDLRNQLFQLAEEKALLLSTLDHQTKEKESALLESKKKIDELKELLKKEQLELKQEARHVLECTIQAYDLKLEEIKQRYDNLVVQFKNDKQSFEKEILNKKVEIQSLSIKLLNLERNNTASLKEKEYEIESLKTALEVQKEDLVNCHKLELEEYEFNSKKQIEELMLQNKNLKEKFELIFKEKEKTVSIYTQNIDVLQASFDTQKKSWEKEKEALVQSLNANIALLQDVIKKKETCIVNLETKLASSKLSEQKLEESLDAAFQSIAKANGDLNSLTEKETLYKKEVYSLESKLSTLQSAQNELRANYQEVTQKNDELFADLEIKRLQSDELNKEFATLKDQTNTLQSQLAAINLQLTKKEEDYVKLHTENQESERLNAELKKKLDHLAKQLLSAENRAEEQKLTSELTLKESMEKYNQTIAALEKRILNLNTALDLEKSTYAAKLVSFRNEKELEMQKKVDDLNNEIELLRKNYANEINSIKAVAEDLNQNLLNEMEISGQKDRLVCDLENRISQLNLDHEAHLNTIQEKFKLDTANTNQLQTQVLEKMKKEHLKTIQEMLSEFEEAQTFMKNQLEKQSQCLKDAEIKYANREAREIDIEKINDLEAEIDRLNRKNNQITEDLNRSRREIQYREESLNRLFNTKPNIGLMNPLSKKSSPTASLGASSPSLRSNPLPPLTSTKGSEEMLQNKSREGSASTSRKPKT